MFYVGVDLHSKLFVVCVLNGGGQVVKRGRFREVSQLLTFLGEIEGQFELCFEASCGYGRWFEIFRKFASRVVVAHPGRLRLIFRSKRKNDRIDAQKLAQLLAMDLVPAVHVPTPDVRAWRESVNYRTGVVAKRTRAKNEIRALLRTLGIAAPKRPGLWTKKGLAWLRSLQLEQRLHRLRLSQLVSEIERLTEDLNVVEAELSLFSKDNTEVWQLRTIPGVGLRTAEAMVAFLDDPHRFQRAKQVGAYFGLVPCQDQSADKNRLGHITREGAPVVRRLLCESAWQAIRRSPTVAAYFLRIQRGDPDRKKIALVATAHYLARVMWSMLKTGTLWQEQVKASVPAAA
jgi:transposase